MFKRWILVGAVAGMGFLVGCDGGGGAAAANPVESEAASEVAGEAASVMDAELAKAVVGNYADIVFAGYADSLAAARFLQGSLQDLVAEPSAETLAAAQAAWRQARVPYLQTEAFRFAEGPIDNAADGVEGLINAWPMDEAYIDSVKGNPEAGIINSPAEYSEITAAMLKELNEKDGETNISTGYHAIEFLLWGQDFSADGPGARTFEDYVVGVGKNADRRGAYLLAAAKLLVGHLQGLANAWDPELGGNYRTEFLALPVEQAVGKIFAGVTVLSGFEVSGERLAVAFETKEQEDEHSCFSDTTHVDMIEDVRGIQNVYLGRYARTDGVVVEGPGLRELIATKEAELAARIASEIEASLAAAQAVPVPFDQAILGEDEAPGRVEIAALIADLRTQAKSLVEAGAALGLTVPVEG